MASRSFISTEEKTIVTTTYQVISIYGVIVESVALYLATSQYSIFPRMQAVFVFLASPLVPLMLKYRKQFTGAVASLITQAIIVFSTTYSDPYSDARLSASSSVFLMCYFGIITFSHRIQLVWISLSSVLWIWIVPGVPLYSNAFGAAANLRWGTLVQLIVSSLALRYVWNIENIRMQQRVEQGAKGDADLTSAIFTRQRLQSWRTSLARVHETILNDIRSILDSNSINGEQILKQLDLSDLSSPPPTSKLSLKGTLAAIESQLSEFDSIEIEQIPNINLDAEISEYLKNVLIELCRNRSRHSGARNLRIRGAKSGKHLVIRLVDDGDISAPDAKASGLGLGVIVREGLDYLNAELSETSGVKVLRMPLPAEEMTNPILPPFSGRAILATTMAGNAIGGGLVFLVLISSSLENEIYAGLSGLTVAALAGWAAFKGSISRILLVIAGFCAGIVPVLVVDTATVVSCTELELNLMAATLTSIGISSLVVWAIQKRLWLAAAPSAIGMIWLSTQVVGTCDASINPTLLASLLSPVLIVVVAYALRDSARREAADRAKALGKVKQMAEIAALEDFSIRLHNFVLESQDLMREIATVNKLSRKNKARLMALDGAIRATIQVDPLLAGAFSTAAENLVLQAADAGVPTRVLVLQDSGDKRELPEFVLKNAIEFILAAKGTASIQILSTPSQDSLTILATKLDASLVWEDFWLTNFQGGSISFNRGLKREPHILIIKRAVILD